MTADLLVRRIRPIIQEVDLSGFPVRFRLKVRKGSTKPQGEERQEVALIEAWFPTVNVVTRKPFNLLHIEAVFPATIESFVERPTLFRIYVLATVRRLLVEMLHHELDEFFSVKGRRPFDPHLGPVPLRPDVETVLRRFKAKPSAAQGSLLNQK